MKSIITYILVLVSCCLNEIQAQNKETLNPSIDWVFFLDGYNTTDLSDAEIDRKGNTYFAANYSMGMSIPGLKQKFPYAGHVIGMLVKLNKKGKVQWAIPFQSSYDNRIKDITLAANGDILLTGHTDGVTRFPGKKDTLDLGTKKPKNQYRRPQHAWLARYNPKGDRVWAKVLGAPWAEGCSVTTDSDDNIYWSMYHKGTLKNGNNVIDSLPSNNSINRVSIFKLNSKGEIQSKLPLQYRADDSNTWLAPKLKVDNENNLLVYGIYKKRILFSDKDSFTNDPYYGTDAFLAKYSPGGELRWLKKVGGQSSEVIRDIVVDQKNRIYAVGSFSYECIITSGINLVQKSTYEYKSGNSFFQARFSPEGALDYAKFFTPPGYSTNCAGYSIALDAAGYSHITGSFSDSVSFREGLNPLITPKHVQCSYNSVWHKDSIVSQSRNIAPHGWNFSFITRINGKRIITGGYYYGKNTIQLSNGKTVKFSEYEHGRASFVYGGTVTKLPPIEDEIVDDSNRGALASMSLPDCYSPLVEQAPDVWFPYIREEKDSSEFMDSSPEYIECGVKLKEKEAKLFPNPSSTVTNLELIGLQGQAIIEIRTEKGDLLFAQQVKVEDQKQTIQFDLSSAAEGLYYITVAQKGYKKVFRLLKVK
jgi:hypothetical protein